MISRSWCFEYSADDSWFRCWVVVELSRKYCLREVRKWRDEVCEALLLTGDRYMEGRKCWASILVQSRNLARYIWVHIQERPGEQGKEDLMAKMYPSPHFLTFD
jgi:hypothetical protein